MSVVLIGTTGEGRTSLFNLITKSTEETGAGGQSVTKSVIVKQAAYGHNAFNVVDTPGLGSSKLIDSAAGIIVALTEEPVQRIIIVVKLRRICLMEQQLLAALAPIKQYKHLVTIAVNFVDQLVDNNREKRMKDIIKYSFDKLGISSVIFISNSETGEEACMKIKKELKSSKAEVISIVTDYEDLFELEEYQYEFLENEVAAGKERFNIDLTRKIMEIQNVIREYSDNDPGITQAMHQVIKQAKALVYQILEQFEKDNQKLMDKIISSGDNPFLFHVWLVRQVERKISLVEELAKEKCANKQSNQIQKFDSLLSQDMKKYKQQLYEEIQLAIQKQKQNIKRLLTINIVQMQVVLIGVIGEGKTTLFNRITKSTERVQGGGNSVTMNVCVKQAAYGNFGFKVLDTPGFGCQMRKMDQAAGIIAALAEGPVSRIIVVIRLDRVDTMKKHAETVIAPVSHFRHLITIAVTHWDLSKDQNADMDSIKQMFQQQNINSVIFTSKNESGQETCLKIEEVLKNSKPEQVNLLGTDYESQFDLAEFYDDLELEIEFSKEELIAPLRKMIKPIQSYIRNYSEHSPNLVQDMKQVIMETTTRACQMLEKFENDHQNLIDNIKSSGGNPFIFHIALIKEMEMDIQDVTEHAQKKCNMQFSQTQKIGGDTFLSNDMKRYKQQFQEQLQLATQKQKQNIKRL